MTFPAETLIFYTVMYQVSIAVAIHYEKTMASLLCRFNFHTECIDCKCVIKASRRVNPSLSIDRFNEGELINKIDVKTSKWDRRCASSGESPRVDTLFFDISK